MIILGNEFCIGNSTCKLLTSEICQLLGIYFTVFDDLSFLLGNK